MEPRELIGTWRFERAIRDHSAGLDYRAEGEADFTQLADGRIQWREHGALAWNGGSTPVEKTLFLVRPSENDDRSPCPARVWTVTFDDGRPFHPWTAGAISHWCSPDNYSGEISEPGEATDAWSITWTVEGPRKDYTMRTTYRRSEATQRPSAAGPSLTSTAN